MSIPLQSTANMDDPEEHCLWALVNIGGDIGAPLLLPLSIMKGWSRHLYEAGFRHHPDLQTRFYQPPSPDSSVWDSVGGKWVESSVPGVSPVPPDEIDTMIDSLPEEMIQRIIRRRGDEGISS